MEFKLKTLTPIWTGNAGGKCDRLHETGIIGSIRWWYEALIRGLGGYACDPRSKNENERCKFNTKSYQQNKNLSAELQNICLACQMFGCTGWSKKIRWIIDDSSTTSNGIKGKNGEFVLHGTEMKTLTDIEKWLLYSVFYIIDRYGTIGGKCMLKPSTNRERGHHCDDRGKISVTKYGLPKTNKPSNLTGFLSEQKNKIEKERGKMPAEWPNLKRFFFSPAESLNASNYMDLVGLYSDFLKGNHRSTPARANKFASFKSGKYFWGYTKDDDAMFDDVKQKLASLKLKKITKGQEVLDAL